MRVHCCVLHRLILLLVITALAKAFVASHPGRSRPLFLLSSTRTMAPHLPLKRKMTSSSSEVSEITERTDAMEARAEEGSPLVDAELDEIIQSIKNIASDNHVDHAKLRTTLKQVAHLSHKDWSRTATNSELLGKSLLPNGMSPGAKTMLSRILNDGNWDRAAKHGTSIPETDHPWAVLVTGVNGIRKTTSIYQTWFPDLLGEALVAPEGVSAADLKRSDLPCGANSFFRQLDHMIATLCNEDFSKLYSLTQAEMNGNEAPDTEVVLRYSNLKAAIFTRYRTLSELLGALLLREAQKLTANCMMETSGRDVAMFHYVDHFFPVGYNKLALHFVINDLSCAKQSVDARMVREIKKGIAAVKEGNTEKIIQANAGGPYGSDVLAGVQEASDRVWNDVVLKNDGIGKDWWKATIAINAHPTKPWTAQAIYPDGTHGTEYTFEDIL